MFSVSVVILLQWSSLQIDDLNQYHYWTEGKLDSHHTTINKGKEMMIEEEIEIFNLPQNETFSVQAELQWNYEIILRQWMRWGASASHLKYWMNMNKLRNQ